MVTRCVVVFVACLAFVGVTAAQVPDQEQIRTRSGPPLTDTLYNWRILSTGSWWIKINPNGTKANSIRWALGKTSGELKNEMAWERPSVPPGEAIPDRRLYPGNMTLLTWETLRTEQVIRVQARTWPETEGASFCLFYQQQGVALVQFTGKVDRLVDRNRPDGLCAPTLPEEQ